MTLVSCSSQMQGVFCWSRRGPTMCRQRRSQSNCSKRAAGTQRGGCVCHQTSRYLKSSLDMVEACFRSNRKSGYWPMNNTGISHFVLGLRRPLKAGFESYRCPSCQKSQATSRRVPGRHLLASQQHHWSSRADLPTRRQKVIELNAFQVVLESQRSSERAAEKWSPTKEHRLYGSGRVGSRF